MNRRFVTKRVVGVVAALFVSISSSGQAKDVVASRYDLNRTGADLHETILSSDNVSVRTFGKIFWYDLTLNGQPGEDVYAQPLYISKVGIPGKGLVNLLLVATTNNLVFAFDADGPKPGTDGILWARSVGKPPSIEDVWKNCTLTSPCLDKSTNIRGHVGIISTPFVDRSRGIVFIVSRVLEGPANIVYRLHALDLWTGNDRAGSPIEIQATALGVKFEAGVQNQRPGLTLARNQIIIAWGSHEDVLPYHGWIMSYRYDDNGSFTQTGAFVTTPGGDTTFTCAVPAPTPATAAADAAVAAELALAAAHLGTGDFVGSAAHALAAATAKAAGNRAAAADPAAANAAAAAANNCAQGGIWMAGRAPAVDGDGNVFLMVGNGKNDMSAITKRNFGNSLLKLDPVSLTVVDFFTPADHLILNAADLDLGGSGPMIIPQSPFIIGGGKQGAMYVWRLDNLGKFSAGDPAVVQKFPAGIVTLHADTGNDKPGGAVIGGFSISEHAGHIMGGPVYWPRPPSRGGSRLFNWSENSELRAYAVDPAAQQPITLPAANGPDIQLGHPGGILTLSANGADSNSGIVWASTYDPGELIQTPVVGDAVQVLGLVGGALNDVRPGILRAYSAENLTPIWTSEQNHDRDTLGSFAKFNPPTVADGRVYVATFSNQLVVYGLLDHTNYVRPAASVFPAVVSSLLDDDP